MKRFIFLCMILITCLCAKSQTSICGVPFGQPYDVAKSILRNKFGNPDISDYNEMWYHARDYAGLSFDFISFKFQSEGSNSYFNECVMGRTFSDASLAKFFRTEICNKLSNKYGALSYFKGTAGFLAARGGESPINEEEYGFLVFIGKNNSKYTVYLVYGPYNYVNEEL